MGYESSDVVRFDLGPLLQGQMKVAKLKSSFKNTVYLLNYVRPAFPGGYILHLATDASLV